MRSIFRACRRIDPAHVQDTNHILQIQIQRFREHLLVLVYCWTIFHEGNTNLFQEMRSLESTGKMCEMLLSKRAIFSSVHFS